MSTELTLPATSVVVNDTTSAGSIFLGMSEDPSRQGGNLLDALRAAISEARAAETDIAAREAIETAQNLVEWLSNAAVTCRCGALLDPLTGICGACIERRAQLDADFRRKVEAGDHAYATAMDIDEAAGF